MLPAEKELAKASQGAPKFRMRELPHTFSCFVCGEANPIGLNLRFVTDGKVVRTHFVPGREHVGFKEVVHGGLIATVLDEVMVWACAVQTKQFAFCAELSVRFAQTLKPGQEALALAEVTANRHNKLFEAKAELRSSTGTLLASAKGKYLLIKAGMTAEMVTDFVGDSDWFLKSK